MSTNSYSISHAKPKYALLLFCGAYLYKIVDTVVTDGVQWGQVGRSGDWRVPPLLT